MNKAVIKKRSLLLGDKEIEARVFLGDCLEVLPAIPENSVDLIVTSPPYADQRSNTYGGIKPEKYVAWFLPRSQEFLRVLKPSGTFILNVKEKVVNSERHPYVGIKSGPNWGNSDQLSALRVKKRN